MRIAKYTLSQAQKDLHSPRLTKMFSKYVFTRFQEERLWVRIRGNLSLDLDHLKSGVVTSLLYWYARDTWVSWLRKIWEEAEITRLSRPLISNTDWP